MDTKPIHPHDLKSGPMHHGRPERCDRIALVLQGGGALGAYQAGVYQALHEAGIAPDWISGVSIGGINAAIIAGKPDRRPAGCPDPILDPHHRPDAVDPCARWRYFPPMAQCL